MAQEQKFGKAELYAALDTFIRETPYNADTRPILDDIYSTRLRFNRNQEIERVIKTKKANPGRNVDPASAQKKNPIITFSEADFEKKTEQAPAAIPNNPAADDSVTAPAPKDATAEMKILDYYTAVSRGEAREKDLAVFRSELSELGIKMKGKATFETLWQALEDKFNEINQ